MLLSPEAFDRLLEKAERVDSLQQFDRSMEDIREGRVRPLKQAVREIAEELDLKLNP